MRTVIVLFNRDLRVHDHPALSAACERAERVVPLFVLDPAVPAGLRHGFLLECLADLRASLRERGGELVVREGDAVTEAMRLAAELDAAAVHVSADVSALARRREERLAAERIEFARFPGVTVVPPDELRPSGGGDHYRVFTPYWNAWRRHPRRRVLPPPGEVRIPHGLAVGKPPRPPDGGSMPGGESAARARADRWLRDGLSGYAEGHDDLAGDRTSRLSPYLRFGCLSPLELAGRAERGEDFVRQLCWRDFHHQVTYAFPRINRENYRRPERRWRHDPDALAAWREGMTGLPIVDAGMRQLLAEGWMHNRARLITAAYLVKRLGLDWRDGERHFFRHLLDGDVADNSGNWQWVAGTGNDTRPNRGFNPLRQAKRYDPSGDYVRRYVPELAEAPGAKIHEPWRLQSPPSGYPARLDGTDAD
ncbi:deoxyribodipyrimidine photo-lyase [Spongiactinospora sp. TRM90649]|uniref:cryptochrome/photolyase family protein n=1 Tax=Spongiactinospora sp. TRM90649 TaxID=3031114 RepID=UPI0023F9705F|nr:deoxyribodipyrimidine photo-lyase [Spongiactinospora sp. TRM90649]MDF5754441.1 deoxyribodipyrimidine photo-lyase [Spongiactinospora sp. TRM90649]